jgi:hypothetical protein
MKVSLSWMCEVLYSKWRNLSLGGCGSEIRSQCPLLVLKGEWIAWTLRWDCIARRPVSQQVWHDNDPSVLKGHKRHFTCTGDVSVKWLKQLTVINLKTPLGGTNQSAKPHCHSRVGTIKISSNSKVISAIPLVLVINLITSIQNTNLWFWKNGPWICQSCDQVSRESKHPLSTSQPTMCSQPDVNKATNHMNLVRYSARLAIPTELNRDYKCIYFDSLEGSCLIQTLVYICVFWIFRYPFAYQERIMGTTINFDCIKNSHPDVAANLQLSIKVFGTDR